MSKEQIEEMADVYDAARLKARETLGSMNEGEAMWYSKAFFEAGYRKQSEVVRCKDCEHFYQDGNIKLCRHWNCHSTEDDAYCGYAKIKGGAE